MSTAEQEITVYSFINLLIKKLVYPCNALKTLAFSLFTHIKPTDTTCPSRNSQIL